MTQSINKFTMGSSCAEFSNTCGISLTQYLADAVGMYTTFSYSKYSDNFLLKVGTE
jgi:hypothetical protein